MKYFKATVLFFVLIFSITGCATDPKPIPKEFLYDAPKVSTSTIKGSQNDSAWADDYTAWISAIDGKRIAAERKGWNQPLTLSKGKHIVSVEFRRGVYNTTTDLELIVRENTAYELKFSTDVGLDGTNTYCDFWVIDTKSTKPVTSLKRGKITLSGYNDPVYIPIII